MKETIGVVFDMDGTLYKFKDSEDGTFAGSIFYTDLKKCIAEYISARLRVSSAIANMVIRSVNDDFGGELSIGFENRYGIDRYEYYRNTWGNMDVERYVQPECSLMSALINYSGKSALLTSAPMVWSSKVMSFLGLEDVFEGKYITGEPDIRKPNEQVFKDAAELLGRQPSDVISVGDQYYTDILPAQKIGMKTLIIGPNKMTADWRADSIVDALRILNSEVF